MNASGRPNTCKSNGSGLGRDSGARVSNAYAICPQEGDSPGKLGVIPHRVEIPHGIFTKVEALEDERASD